MEIDEEEDTTTTSDFCKPFFATHATQDQKLGFATTFAKISPYNDHMQPWTFKDLLSTRLCSHNKDLRLICADGGVQIDPLILRPFLSHGTTLMGHDGTTFMGHGGTDEAWGAAQTVMIPDIHLAELHQMMTLFHKVFH